MTPKVIQQGELSNPGGTNTFNIDLREYIDRGSKLIHYHGWADRECAGAGTADVLARVAGGGELLTLDAFPPCPCPREQN